MTGSQVVAPPTAPEMQSRQARLRQANLAIVIVLIVRFGLGIGVNLYIAIFGVNVRICRCESAGRTAGRPGPRSAPHPGAR